jgi:hypothetical protein
MKLKTLVIALLLILLYVSSVDGQISLTMKSRQVTETITTDIPVAVVNPDLVGVSTKEFAAQFPKSGIIPENIKINYPNLSDALDTVAILWYLKPENYSAKGEVNIILVTINSDSIKKFYIDNNNDRTFADNEEKFSFDPNTEKKILEIKILGNYYTYTLLNPDFKSPASGPWRIGEYSKSWRAASKKPSIALDFSVLTGGGKFDMILEHPDATYYLYKYWATNHSSLKPGIGIDFSWLNFQISVAGIYERLQFESVKRYFYQTPTGIPIKMYNRNFYPKAMFHYGISAEYNIRIYKVYFSPFVGYYKSDILNDYVFDKTTFPNAKMEDWTSKEAGMKFKVPIANRTMLYLKYAYSRSYFTLSGFFPVDSPPVTSYHYIQNHFGFGFQYRILGK